METPAHPAATGAMRKSLQALNLAQAYTTWDSGPLLLRELLSAEPLALVAVGPAARRVDELDYPLVTTPFHAAEEGRWFQWRRDTAGLLLPPLTPALDDEAAKRRFWQAFLRLRPLATEG